MAYTETQAAVFPEADFRIGRVVSKTLEVFSRNIVTFTLIAGIVQLPLLVDFGMEQFGQASGEAPTRLGQLNRQLLSSFLDMVFSGLSTAVILQGALQFMRGRSRNVRESFTTAGSRILPLLGVILLTAVGEFLGFLLLIVPGIVLMMMWSVVVPVTIVEGASPSRSLARSRELTKGCLWKIFAILFAGFLCLGGGLYLVWGVTVALGMGLWEYIGLMWVYYALSGGVCGVLYAVIYYYLRVAKEGVDVDQIAAVFD